MLMSESEQQQIIQCADFLEQKGYTRSSGNGMLRYDGDGQEIMITFEPNSDISDISIKFAKENEVYSVGWIACVRSGLEVKPHQRLENAIRLLSYIKENYNTIMDINYCRESNKLIDEFIDGKRI